MVCGLLYLRPAERKGRCGKILERGRKEGERGRESRES